MYSGTVKRVSPLQDIKLRVQITVSLEMEDNDPNKEYLYAKGLSEFVTWLNADKVRVCLHNYFILVVASLSSFCMSDDAKMQCGSIISFLPYITSSYLLF
jgi:DNA gyrase/topoisomerase IV subunit B